ncbi:hypothetical protein [Bacillus sp. PK3_68]|uniref:hypothetical protein n=1 Tax=Bacillus sp. PK3_68 TaxID=2027408 RepID=UPI000E761D54|nr:hypothetical protein [Bacillus sp. PK3_68]RJS60482.1 hypothetical protein CJ483_10700 [Bacillus sp. PK3_68]
MNWFTIGSLTVPAAQLAILAAFIIGALVIWLKKDKVFLELYVNAVFLFVAVWKVSVLLFSFMLVVKSPLSLMYFNGGWKGIWLGLIAVCIYLLWKTPAEKRPQIIWTWMIVIISFEWMLSLLRGQAGLLAWIQLAGGVAQLAVPLRQAAGTIWLFTLWQLLFESLTADLFYLHSLFYIGAALFFTFIVRRDPIE